MDTTNNSPLFGPYGSAALEFITLLKNTVRTRFGFTASKRQLLKPARSTTLPLAWNFKTFRADFAIHPELVPTGADGKPIRYGSLVQGVCLSNKDFLEETEANLLAGLRAFQPRGIWLDYLTYAGWFETPEPDLQESCFCPDCIAEFCKATGIDAATPKRILEAHAQAWTEHKCKRVARFALQYAALIRQYLPECIVGAYMCPWTSDEFDGALRRIFAQDYDLLAPAIDIFTPLIYCAKSGRPNSWGREFLKQAPRFVPPGRQVQLILDVLDYPDSLSETAKAPDPGWGMQLFGGAKVFGDRTQAVIFRRAIEQMRQG